MWRSWSVRLREAVLGLVSHGLLFNLDSTSITVEGGDLIAQVIASTSRSAQSDGSAS